MRQDCPSHSPNARHMLNPAKRHEHAGKNDEGEDEISDRPRGDDRSPISQWLTSQGQRTIDPGASVYAFADADAGGIRVAMKFDISAKRQCANPPTCAAESTCAASSGPKPSENASILTPHIGQPDSAQVRAPQTIRLRIIIKGTTYHPNQARRSATACTPAICGPSNSNCRIGQRPADNGYSRVSKVAQVRAYANRLAVRSFATW